jgi:predicted ATPase with chaperone activity
MTFKKILVKLRSFFKPHHLLTLLPYIPGVPGWTGTALAVHRVVKSHNGNVTLESLQEQVKILEKRITYLEEKH